MAVDADDWFAVVTKTKDLLRIGLNSFSVWSFQPVLASLNFQSLKVLEEPVDVEFGLR